MKPVLLVFSLIACMLVTILYAIPKYAKEETILESVIIDKTDPFSVIPSIYDILLPLHLNKNTWNRFTVRIQTASNFEINRIESLQLPSQYALLSNPDVRNGEVTVFKQSVANSIDSINKLPNGKPKSSIYASVVSETNTLASLKAKRKVVIVYSDLQENSTSFSIYNPHTLAQAKANPDRARSQLEHIATPSNLHDIEVYFIFKPNTESDNDNFMVMSKLFASILERAGATVYIGDNVVEE